MADNAPDKIILEITADNREFLAKFKDALSKIEDQAQDALSRIDEMFKKLKLIPDAQRTKKDFEVMRTALVDELTKLKNLRLDAVGKINTDGINKENKKQAQEMIKSTTLMIQQLENRLRAYNTYVSSLQKATKSELDNEKRAQKERERLAQDDIKRVRQIGEISIAQNERILKESQKEKERLAQEDINRLKKLGEIELAQNERKSREAQRISQAQLNSERNAQKEKDKIAQDDVKRLRQLGEVAFAQNERRMRDMQKARTDDKKSLVDWGKVWQTVLTNIISILGALGINTSLQGFISFLKEATEKSLELSQAQFNLSVQVGAAQRVLGSTAAGSLTEWQQKIKQLRAELKIYSEADITKAVSQTSILTRVLGLNKDKQEEVIRIASVLAQTTGVDLSQAVDDVTKALGGSSVVLDKYGLFIRDADKGAAAFQLGFTEKVLKGTQSLNSQQLALATLQTILTQVNPLYESLGNFQDTVSGKMKSTTAVIEDQTTKLGTNLQQWKLFADNLKLSLLEALNAVINSDAFKMVNEMLRSINNSQETLRTLGRAPDPGDFGLLTDFGKIDMIEAGEKMNEGILLDKSVLRGNVPISKQEFDRRFEEYKNALMEFNNKRNKLNKETADRALADQRAEERGTGGTTGTGLPGSSEEDTEELEKIEKLTKRFGLQIVDAYKEWQKDQKDALNKKNEDLKKANADEIRELDKHQKDLERELQDLVIDVLRRRVDLETKHSRDVQDLESDTNNKRDEIERDHQQKQIDNTEKYYDALRDLENQYYFDLRDAVAENDAVAIKRLERKFNLDKSKLDDNLNDQQNQENTSFNERIADLEQNSIDRKAELDRRYQQEIDDLRLYEERKREDIALDNERELEDLRQHFDEIRANIIVEYQNQLIEIENSYNERLLSISDALAQEEDVNLLFLDRLFHTYDSYIGPNGSITQLYLEFFNRRREAEGQLASNFLPNFTQLQPQTTADLSSQRLSPSAELLRIELALDDDLLENKVITYTGDIIQDVVVRRPTSGRAGVQ